MTMSLYYGLAQSGKTLHKQGSMHKFSRSINYSSSMMIIRLIDHMTIISQVLPDHTNQISTAYFPMWQKWYHSIIWDVNMHVRRDLIVGVFHMMVWSDCTIYYVIVSANIRCSDQMFWRGHLFNTDYSGLAVIPNIIYIILPVISFRKLEMNKMDAWLCRCVCVCVCVCVINIMTQSYRWYIDCQWPLLFHKWWSMASLSWCSRWPAPWPWQHILHL